MADTHERDEEIKRKLHVLAFLLFRFVPVNMVLVAPISLLLLLLFMFTSDLALCNMYKCTR